MRRWSSSTTSGNEEGIPVLDIALPHIKSTETDQNFASYDIEPLEAGYGRTLGNALRRVLLSSLPGAAVTAIKIEGAQHEFQDVPGVREDVTDIVLNVKKLRLRTHSDQPVTMRVEISGERVVTAQTSRRQAQSRSSTRMSIFARWMAPTPIWR